MRILSKIRDCSKLGFHAWYKTDLGFPVRKPILSIHKGDLYADRIEYHLSWWEKVWKFILRLFKKL